MSGAPVARERALARAERYPYAAPRSSFVLVGGRELELALPGPDLGSACARDRASGREVALAELAAPDLGSEALGRRTPVLAYGANRTADALARKQRLAGFPAGSALVVLRARLRHLDVVHSAHVSPYGAIGATLARSEGTSVEVCVTLLSDAQVAAMADTEPNYTLEELHAVEVELEGGARLGRVSAFVSRHGALAVDGGEVALRAIAARDRRLPELSQREAQAAAAARAGHRGGLDEFILANVADPELAARRTSDLRRDSRPLDWPRARTR